MDGYAVIEMGGKQYRVEEGQALLVDRVDVGVGDRVKPRPLMYRDADNIVFEQPELDKVSVDAVVDEHLRGEKIRVFKYKAKQGYHRQAGHRSELTRIKVEAIKLGK